MSTTFANAVSNSVFPPSVSKRRRPLLSVNVPERDANQTSRNFAGASCARELNVALRPALWRL